MSPFDEATNWNEDGVSGTVALPDARVDDGAALCRGGRAGGKSERRNHQARAQDHPRR